MTNPCVHEQNISEYECKTVISKQKLGCCSWWSFNCSCHVSWKQSSCHVSWNFCMVYRVTHDEECHPLQAYHWRLKAGTQLTCSKTSAADNVKKNNNNPTHTITENHHIFQNTDCLTNLFMSGIWRQVIDFLHLSRETKKDISIMRNTHT